MTKKSKIVLASSIIGAAALTAGIPLFAWGLQVGIQKSEDKKAAYNALKSYNSLVFTDSTSGVQNALNAVSEHEKLISAANKKVAEAQTEDERAKANEELKTLTDALPAKNSELKTAIETLKSQIDLASNIVKYNFGRKEVEKENIEAITANYILAVKIIADIEKGIELEGVNEDFPSEEEVEKIVKFYNGVISKLELINDANLNTITKAWAAGVKFDWEIIMSNYNSGGRYVLTWFNWNPSYAYPANSFYGTIGRIPESQAERVLQNLKEAVQNNITLSKVVIKNNLNSILSRVYSNELKEFAKDDTKNEISVVDLIAMNKKSTKLNELYTWYATEYYNAAKHGVGEDLKELKLYKTNVVNELENTLEVVVDNNSKLIYGLGLTDKDLNAKNIGLSGIQGNEETTNGDKLYKAILKMSTTTNDTADEVYQSGYETSKTASKNMSLVASEVADLIAGKNNAWTATFKYDSDGVASKPVEEITLTIRNENGEINLEAFNKWLNQEQFFFGREDKSFYSTERMQELDNDESLKEARELLVKLGYSFLKDSDKAYGSITEKQFYYGVLEAFKGYYQFKATTEELGYQFFASKVKTYGIDTYEYGERTEAGVGAYNGGKAYFQFNSDPYFSLPKWSVTSFANHESVMGHHNQIYYAKEYLEKYNNTNLGNIFDYTSYVEGWALFVEWLAIETGWYGTPDYNNANNDYYALPVDFSYAKGITNFFTKEAAEADTTTAEGKAKVTESMINQIKNLHGGVYWTLVDSINQSANDQEHAQKAVKLTNMLQYYGALNEAQLRNMRRAIDTAYHGTGVQGKDDLPAAPSINEVRAFMKANSALGIGDISSESKRYLNLPGQATSYNAGKENMLHYYDKVRNKLGLSREEMVNAVHGFYIENRRFEDKKHGYIQEFLQYILMNGALPLGALDAVLDLAYNLKK
ncbi:DUF885 family protein [Metamycoplasma spumans]|uniref:DUF885 family protein n=1 Tax=Metamycoplasma spumans TaxID=92406 RepID=UPI0034DD3317